MEVKCLVCTKHFLVRKDILSVKLPTDMYLVFEMSGGMKMLTLMTTSRIHLLSTDFDFYHYWLRRICFLCVFFMNYVVFSPHAGGCSQSLVHGLQSACVVDVYEV
jgi:hypothetical protein